MRRSLLGAGALLVLGMRAAAQVDTVRPPPRPPPDSAAASDTTAPDTAERFLAAFATGVAPGPLPRGTRWFFDTDSLVLSNIMTLGDLLGRIPGVYVARGGWFGAPEIVVYGGQGPLSLELYWDGAPYLPLGRDSVWLDPARVPLAPLERVEIQLLPSTLRVYLVSTRLRSTVPRTEVRISTGVHSIAQYRGGFAKRWRSGFGLSLAADYRSTDGIGTSSTTAFNGVDLWLGAEYVPSPRIGFSYQILSSSWDRAGQGTVVDGWKQHRTDGLFRAFAATRADGRGTRLALTVARSQLSGDTLVRDRALTQAIVDLSETRSRASAGVTARFQGAGRPAQVEAHVGWTPVRFLTVAADGRRTWYKDRGHGNRGHVAAGLALPFGVSARAELSRVEDFQAPLIPADTFQWATDFAAYVRWDRRPITLEVGQVRRDPFRPLTFATGIRPVASLGPLPRSTYASLFLGLRPVPGVQLSGWYFDPREGGGDFEPPTHGRVSAAFYSKFWRVYKSGAFALRGEVAAESWSRSNLGGRDTTGSQLRLGPATFVEINIEMRIGDFTAYWQTRNYNAMRASYVTGLGYPKYAQYYGVQWFFRN